MASPVGLASSGNLDAAIIAATISILLGGILFGLGIGFGLRRVRIFGAEEIGQGIISAAMVGALALFMATINSVSGSIIPEGALASCGQQSSASLPFSYYSCSLAAVSNSTLRLSNGLARAADITGFASSLEISAGAVSASPFFALQSASKSLSDASMRATLLYSLSAFELGLAASAAGPAFAILLPAGLGLRTFFVTRRLGAAAMAIAVAAYAVYPLLFVQTFKESATVGALQGASGLAESFNEKFASIPLLELDETSSVRDKVREMSGGDFGSQVQQLFPVSYSAFSTAETDLVAYPLISLLISAVAAVELYGFFSAPIFLPYFESV